MEKSLYSARGNPVWMSRRRLIGGAALGATSLALAACVSRTPSPAGNTASNAASSAQPKPGGQANIRISKDFVNFDISTAEKGIVQQLTIPYSHVVRFKFGPDVKYSDLIVEPDLAEKWESPDAQTYTFHLRQGVKFANLPPVNGRALTSDDIKFSYEYATRTGQLKGAKLPGGAFNFLLEGLDQIQTPDPGTVVVRFKQPFAPFLNYAPAAGLSILPHEIYDQDGDFTKRIVGSGPFQLDVASSHKATKWIFKKNPDYWEAGKPYIDQLSMLVLPDDATTYAAFETKQTDWLSGSTVTPPIADQVKKNNPDAVSYDYLYIGPQHIWINQREGYVFHDERVRQAMALAVNRDELMKALEEGKGQWAVAGAFPDTFTQDEVKQLLKFDPAQGKQLMSAAGYANGTDVECIYSSVSSAYSVSLLQLLQSQFRQVGINLSLKPVDTTSVSQRKRKGDFVMTVAPKDLETDVDSYLYQDFYPTSTSNYAATNDPQLTSLLEAQRREPDEAKRKTIVQQAARYITQHALDVALYYPQHAEFWHPYLKNYAPNFGNAGKENGPQFVQSWLEK